MMTDEKVYSIVCLLQNDSQRVELFVTEVVQELIAQKFQFEIILVDNGSADQTTDICRSLIEKISGCRLIKLTRVHAMDVAITAGLDLAIGDYVVAAEVALDSPEHVLLALDEAVRTQKVVLGQCNDPQGTTVIYRSLRALFVWVARMMDINIVRNITFLIAMPRFAVSLLQQSEEKFRFLRLLTQDLGLPTVILSYTRSSISKKLVRKRKVSDVVGPSLRILFTQSMSPLRMLSLSAVVLCLLNFVYVGYIFVIYFLNEDVAPGWTTLSLQLAVGFFLIFLILAALAEYLGAIFEETRKRNLYYISEDKSSSQSINSAWDRNIVSTAIDVKEGL